MPRRCELGSGHGVWVQMSGHFTHPRSCSPPFSPKTLANLVQRLAPDAVGQVVADVLDNADKNLVGGRGEVAGVVVLHRVDPAKEQVVETVFGKREGGGGVTRNAP